MFDFGITHSLIKFPNYYIGQTWAGHPSHFVMKSISWEQNWLNCWLCERAEKAPTRLSCNAKNNRASCCALFFSYRQIQTPIAIQVLKLELKKRWSSTYYMYVPLSWCYWLGSCFPPTFESPKFKSSWDSCSPKNPAFCIMIPNLTWIQKKIPLH